MLMFCLSLLLLPPTLCDTALDTFGHSDTRHAESVHAMCSDTVRAALLYNIDPFIAVSTCEEETKCLPNLISTAGAQGPLQVTHYWVEGSVSSMSQFQLIQAGTRALFLLKNCKSINWETYTCNSKRSRVKVWGEVLCHYNGGNVCGESSRNYSNRILSNTKRLKKAFNKKYRNARRLDY